MYLENNNIKVLKIFFNFLQKNQGKFLKNLEKFRKIFRKFRIFQKIQKNVLENLVNFYKIQRIFYKKNKNSETSTVELF